MKVRSPLDMETGLVMSKMLNRHLLDISKGEAKNAVIYHLGLGKRGRLVGSFSRLEIEFRAIYAVVDVHWEDECIDRNLTIFHDEPVYYGAENDQTRRE